jgi:hypothetical protein
MMPSNPSMLNGVVKLSAGNDPDAHSQSTANITEIADFLVVPKNAANTSVRAATKPYALLQNMATSGRWLGGMGVIQADEKPAIRKQQTSPRNFCVADNTRTIGVAVAPKAVR